MTSVVDWYAFVIDNTFALNILNHLCDQVVREVDFALITFLKYASQVIRASDLEWVNLC